MMLRVKVDPETQDPADLPEFVAGGRQWDDFRGSNGDPNTLYFADGINGENDGLFGAIFATGNGS